MAKMLDEKKLAKLLSIMHDEGHARKAAVFKVERELGKSHFRALVFTMLSARTKDETTLRVCKKLFLAADSPKKMARLEIKKLEKILYGVGFYRVKARHLKKTCELLAEKFHSKVPNTLEGLTFLPGVGRKTANVVLARAFGKATIGVDIHVHRIANLMGMVKTKKPEETERILMGIVPVRLRSRFNLAFVAFGQTHSLKNLAFDIEILLFKAGG